MVLGMDRFKTLQIKVKLIDGELVANDTQTWEEMYTGQVSEVVYLAMLEKTLDAVQSLKGPVTLVQGYTQITIPLSQIKYLMVHTTKE